MNAIEKHIIYTIGHSTHPIAEFLAMLDGFKIEMLVDIRRFPGSRKFPQYDQENLKNVLEAVGINYMHEVELGGRRTPKKDSKNSRWNNPSFRGYADYMETDEFKSAIEKLEEIALKKVTVYMCSEAVWWRCHRSMVSDYLKAKGWDVWHIMAVGKATEHQYTAPALISGEKVIYSDAELTTKNTIL